MGRTPETPLKKAFMETVGFAKVVELGQSILDKFDYETMGLDRIMIMPDVNSLHVFWQERDGSIYHQIIDYPYPDDNETLESFLSKIAEWAEGETWGDSLEQAATEDFYRLLDYKLEWRTLEGAYIRMKSAFELIENLLEATR